MYRQAFAGGGQTNLSSPLEFFGGLESVESESLLTNGGSTNVLDCLISLEECNEEILNSDDFLVPRQLTIQNDMGIACHPELVSGCRCIKSPKPLFTKGGKTLASLGKGSGTEVPEGLRKFTLTRIAKFTKFIKQFNPLTKREGKELGYTKFYSRTYTVLTPHPSPCPLRERENQAFLGKGGGTNVPEGFKKRKAAFTLAEVLITLGIIGVVAAMTLPTVITNVQKKVVENQLKVFNTTINNAFRMAQAEHGGRFDDWIPSYHYLSFTEMREWLEKYLFPYIKYSDVSDCRGEDMVGDNTFIQEGICFHMANGALIWIHINDDGGDLIYYVNGKIQSNPRNSFQFQFAKTNKKSEFVEPYVFNWNGNESSLKTDGTWGCYKGCTNCGYCTKLIQLNNWEIPDDYPW